MGNQLTFTFHEGNPSTHQFEAQLWQRVGDQYFDAEGVLEKSGQALSLVSRKASVTGGKGPTDLSVG